MSKHYVRTPPLLYIRKTSITYGRYVLYFLCGFDYMDRKDEKNFSFLRQQDRNPSHRPMRSKVNFIPYESHPQTHQDIMRTSDYYVNISRAVDLRSDFLYIDWQFAGIV